MKKLITIRNTRHLRGNPRRGFTMIEIIVVVVIIAVMFTVSFPSLRAVNDNNRLRSSVRELSNLMKYARSEAVFNSRTTEVFLDTEKHEFWLDLRKPNEKTGRYNPKDPKTTMERKRELETKVQFDSVTALDNNILSGGIIAFDFYPDGTASPGLVTLRNNRDLRYTVEVIKPTGSVKIHDMGMDDAKTEIESVSYPLPGDYNQGYGSL